jgi:hypothetical protein
MTSLQRCPEDTSGGPQLSFLYNSSPAPTARWSMSCCLAISFMIFLLLFVSGHSDFYIVEEEVLIFPLPGFANLTLLVCFSNEPHACGWWVRAQPNIIHRDVFREYPSPLMGWLTRHHDLHKFINLESQTTCGINLIPKAILKQCVPGSVVTNLPEWFPPMMNRQISFLVHFWTPFPTPPLMRALVGIPPTPRHHIFLQHSSHTHSKAPSCPAVPDFFILCVLYGGGMVYSRACWCILPSTNWCLEWDYFPCVASGGGMKACGENCHSKSPGDNREPAEHLSPSQRDLPLMAINVPKLLVIF